MKRASRRQFPWVTLAACLVLGAAWYYLIGVVLFGPTATLYIEISTSLVAIIGATVIGILLPLIVWQRRRHRPLRGFFCALCDKSLFNEQDVVFVDDRSARNTLVCPDCAEDYEKWGERTVHLHRQAHG